MGVVVVSFCVGLGILSVWVARHETRKRRANQTTAREYAGNLAFAAGLMLAAVAGSAYFGSGLTWELGATPQQKDERILKNEQLLGQVEGELQSGGLGDSQAREQLAERLKSGDRKSATDPSTVNALVRTGALLVGNTRAWGETRIARQVYDLAEQCDASAVSAAAAGAVASPGGVIDKSSVVVFVVKLGRPGTETDLAALLEQCGDKQLAEDYLNSGSEVLAQAAKQWAADHGYEIESGTGSTRAAWGQY